MFRCTKKNTSETDQQSVVTTMTMEDGVSNQGIEEDGLVSATRQRVPDARAVPDKLDPRVEQMLDDAYADARKFAKFPNMP